MRWLNVLLVTGALIFLSLAGRSAQAQPASSDGASPHIRAALIAETMRPAPGSKTTLALMMQPDKGWHGYWDNPGDAGVGLTMDWNLPGEVTASPFRYPVPQRLLISGLMNHVYEHDYALLFDVTIPPDAKPGKTLEIAGHARWLACTDSICVPEQGRVLISLTVGDGKVNATERAQFDGLRAQLPRPLDQPAHFAREGERISFAVPYPASAPVGEPWFFAQTQGRVRYAEPQIARRKGDMLIIETAVAPDSPDTGPIDGVLVVAPNVALQISATAGEVPSGGDVIGSAPASTTGGAFTIVGFLLTLGGAILGGLILNVMPCVFPILSLKAISLAKAGGDELQARSEALAYTGGVLLTCLALGATMLIIKAGGTQIGWAFQLQYPPINALLLILMVAITANMAGLFELGTIAIGQSKAGQGGHAGAFWTGALAAFVATPCLGPFLATAMGAALILPWPLTLAVFAGLALGMASPFLAIAWIPALRRLMPRPGQWMVTFRRVMAVPMALTTLALLWLLWRQLGFGGLALGLGLMLVTGVALLWIGKTQHAGRALNKPISLGLLLALCGVAIAAPPMVRSDTVEAGAGLTGTPFSEAALAKARQAGKPVFLYFTADWCLTCKVNEANAIDNADVKATFDKAGVETMVGDWTSANPAITRFLESQGRSGVPLYLYYPKGASQPQILPQVLTPGTLTDLVKG